MQPDNAATNLRWSERKKRERAEAILDDRAQESKNRYWRPVALELAQDVLTLLDRIERMRDGRIAS